MMNLGRWMEARESLDKARKARAQSRSHSLRGGRLDC